jgi:hypothetical protein
MAKEHTRKKCKSMRELKTYMGVSARKNKDSYKGWLQEGKTFVVMITKATKDDIESRQHVEWEKLYKKICATVKMTSDEEENEGDGDNDKDYSVLYCEV